MAKKSMDSGFLSSFKKDLEGMSGIGTSSQPPRYWYSFGNYVLNKIMSGSFTRGIPQGRVTSVAGPSGAGKSYLAANLVKSAQQAGAIILVVDSENALDDEFMGKIGVNTEENYFYAAVTTIPQVTKVVSSFIRGYKSEYGTAEDAPQVLIVIDSLDMLMTETEQDHYEKGNQKGDQGQRNKQLKQMLRTFVQDIKQLNLSMVYTSQVYKNQDIMNGEGVWIVSDAVKYSASQIVLVQKRKLKDATAKAGEYAGVRIVAEGYKTRFCKPFQRVELEVPYDTGMDPCSGLLEAAVGAGVVVRSGGWYTLADSDEKWRSADIAQYVDQILAKLDGDDVVLDTSANTDDSVEESARSKRKAKYAGTSGTAEDEGE